MKIKERAVYAWGRIVDLFKPKKPEIEVEIEEMNEEVPVDVLDEVTEPTPETVPDEVSDSPVPDRMGGEEPIPSRMTDEYKAWMEEQFASESDPSPDDL